jgi:protein-tyrosine kinase
MDSIRQALERTKNRDAGADRRSQATRLAPQKSILARDEVVLDDDYLQSKRIIAHLNKDARARPFGMLRTQILQAMDLKGWRTVAITSPTPGCGKTLVASNLTLSIARQSERSVLLVDLDFQRPQVAPCMGLNCEAGILNVLQGAAGLSDEIVPARIGNIPFLVLPTIQTVGSSEIITSRAMIELLEDLKRGPFAQTIILDLPPILAGDDVIAILPHIDCVILVAAVGTTTVKQIEETRKHLRASEVIRVVLNKVSETSTGYHYYY